MLSLAHRFLFIHVPKTAGNAVHRALLPFSEDRMELVGPHQDGVERFEIRSPTIEMHKHLSLAEYRARLSPAQREGLFTFCGVRNPWDRCVSFFFSPHRGAVDWSPEAFETFVRDEVRPVEDYLALGPKDPDPFGNVDAVLRFEHLERDFAEVCRRIGIAAPDLPRANAGRHADYRTYYRTDRMIERVATKFAAEIRRFGYGFDG